jgi:hypothetical protein
MRITNFFLTTAIAVFSADVSLASVKSSHTPATHSTNLALSGGTEVICLDKTYARAETKNFYVNICGNSSRPTRYMGSGKGGQVLILPLKSYGSGQYVAVSGTIRYVLTSSYLKVTQNGRTIVNQKVISWR